MVIYPLGGKSIQNNLESGVPAGAQPDKQTDKFVKI